MSGFELDCMDCIRKYCKFSQNQKTDKYLDDTENKSHVQCRIYL